MERPERPAGVGVECRHCRYFDTITNVVAKQQFSICRRNAPRSTGQVVGMTSPGVDGNGQPTAPQPLWSYTTLWSAVGANDWCGEFMKKLESVK